MDTAETQPLFHDGPPQAKSCDAAHSTSLPNVVPPMCVEAVVLEFAQNPPVSFDPGQQIKKNFKSALEEEKTGQGLLSFICSPYMFCRCVSLSPQARSLL